MNYFEFCKWLWNSYFEQIKDFALLPEIRGMRNLIEIQKKRIDALEKVYYSTNGG